MNSNSILPPWLEEVARLCPSIFTFETRQLPLFATKFDRDRAMHRLLVLETDLIDDKRKESLTARMKRSTSRA